jgi:transcriptional regulator with XRE-family HTH domain
LAKAAGLSVNSIEKEAGLSTGSLCKWNTVSPTVRSLKKVSDILNVPVEKLLESGKEEDT